MNGLVVDKSGAQGRGKREKKEVNKWRVLIVRKEIGIGIGTLVINVVRAKGGGD